MTAHTKITQGLRSVASSLAQGFFEITHNSFALLGLAVMFIVITLTARPELRQVGEVQLFSWLQTRQAPVAEAAADTDTTEYTTASDAEDLPKQQAAVAFWLSKRYRVASEPLRALVAEAYEVGTQAKLDPTLILAVMAIESRFNPFAQSSVGAQGLMQVMTQVHRDKYQNFGGKLAAFDPVANLRVGAKVLQDCIRSAGSIEGGLKSYVGAADTDDDGGYTAKVMAERSRLQMVAQGRKVPMFAAALNPPASANTSKTMPVVPAEKADALALNEPRQLN